jgi:hypothetical protein
MKLISSLFISVFAQYEYFYDSSQDYLNEDIFNYDDYGNKKLKNKNKYFGQGKNVEGDPNPDMGHNGHQCWQCREQNYADCATNAILVNCIGEQFHCNIRENKQFGKVVKVVMGKFKNSGLKIYVVYEKIIANLI